MSNKKELVHYGISGQKWGTRRWQYADGRFNEAGKERYFGRRNINSKNVDPYDTSEATHINGIKLDKYSKEIYIGEKVPSLIKASNSVKDTHDTFNYKKISDIEKEGMLHNINKIDYTKPGTYMNCGNCTMAYDLISRGVECNAGYNSSGMYYDDMVKCYSGITEDSFHHFSTKNVQTLFGKHSGVNDFKKELAESIKDDYARGAISLPWMSGGHFIAWEKKGDSIKFTDAQNPNYDVDSIFKQIDTNSISSLIDGGVRSIRLDNLKVNEKEIQKWVNVKGKTNKVEKSVNDRVSDFKAKESSNKVSIKINENIPAKSISVKDAQKYLKINSDGTYSVKDSYKKSQEANYVLKVATGAAFSLAALGAITGAYTALDANSAITNAGIGALTGLGLGSIIGTAGGSSLVSKDKGESGIVAREYNTNNMSRKETKEEIDYINQLVDEAYQRQLDKLKNNEKIELLNK